MKLPFFFLGAALLFSCGGPDPFCGDLNVDPDEECDGAAPCRADCTLPVCGDGIVDSALNERCDDGNTNDNDGCRADCLGLEICGDGLVDAAAGESCDDGNNSNNDACLTTCANNVCGDSFVNPAAEECDDANNIDADDCKSDCTDNVCGDGSLNAANEICDDGNTAAGDNCRADCLGLEVCGDGLLDVDEACDDGDTISGDGCRSDCAGVELCGDALLDVDEVCDDGNTSAGDDCRADCAGLELCGDGLLDAATGEACDDANNTAGDDCRADCLGLEVCGDGLVDTINGEQCDDGNTNNNDGCDADCNPTTIEQISVGENQICSILRSGDVRCWGDTSNSGLLGYGNDIDIGDDEPPFTAGDVNIGGAVTQIATGGIHTCALLDNGAVRCWGNNVNGQLGYATPGNIGDNESPASAGDVPIGGAVAQLAAGVLHTCALLIDGNVRCWGRSLEGQLGYGNTLTIGDNETPANAGNINLGGAAIQIAAGDDHTCVILDNNAVRCWGRGFSGALGYGNISNIGDNETPASAGDVNLGGVAVQLTAGGFHTCALLDNGAIRCWGDSGGGQLGYGNTTDIGDNEAPAAAGDVSLGGSAIQVAAGDFHTCALFTTGDLRCWGLANQGQLGYGNIDNIGDNELPSTAGFVPAGGVSLQVDTGGFRSCAVLNTGTVRCWGSPILGYGNLLTIGDNETPDAIGDVLVF
jgi:cysteine-rich repeat protein